MHALRPYKLYCFNSALGRHAAMRTLTRTRTRHQEAGRWPLAAGHDKTDTLSEAALTADGLTPLLLPFYPLYSTLHTGHDRPVGQPSPPPRHFGGGVAGPAGRQALPSHLAPSAREARLDCCVSKPPQQLLTTGWRTARSTRPTSSTSRLGESACHRRAREPAPGKSSAQD